MLERGEQDDVLVAELVDPSVSGQMGHTSGKHRIEPADGPELEGLNAWDIFVTTLPAEEEDELDDLRSDSDA